MSPAGPTMSVVCSTYNGTRFIDEQFASLERGESLPEEVVVRDDGSSDDTVARVHDWLARLAERGVRGRLISDNLGNLGPSRSFERALKEATCDVLVLMDQDDVWKPERLTRLRDAFSDPAIIWAMSDAHLLDAHGQQLPGSLWEAAAVSGDFLLLVEEGRAFEALRSFPRVTGATMAFRRAALPHLLPLPALVGTSETPPWHLHDGWFAMLLALLGRAAVIRECLIYYRLHDEQVASVRMSGKDAEGLNARWSHRERLRIQVRNTAPVLQRLRELPSSPAIDYERARLTELTQHLTARLEAVDTPRWQRPPRVLREIASGRYSRHSRMLRSSVRDLIS